jgi:hypothetical protein
MRPILIVLCCIVAAIVCAPASAQCQGGSCGRVKSTLRLSRLKPSRPLFSGKLRSRLKAARFSQN